MQNTGHCNPAAIQEELKVAIEVFNDFLFYGQQEDEPFLKRIYKQRFAEWKQIHGKLSQLQSELNNPKST
ncbi:hypothetical protein [Pedobacter nutrimenti]|uniref:hypothetical protein n=1 Tax=Pedobacter nutrimenti TaxID=1241337 RepID=UPI0029317C24|nr:hypothetical protein [Pedobacter nutrimenti]